MRKYELTEIRNHRGLYQIKALRDFGKVSKGDLGGFIESEYNLSHDGDCWVGGNARVFGRAWVFQEGKVFDSAWVRDNNEVTI